MAVLSSLESLQCRFLAILEGNKKNCDVNLIMTWRVARYRDDFSVAVKIGSNLS